MNEPKAEWKLVRRGQLPALDHCGEQIYDSIVVLERLGLHRSYWLLAAVAVSKSGKNMVS